MTGFTKHEKEVICQLLTNFGVPVTSDSKHDYQFIRTKMIEQMKNETPETKAQVETKENKLEEITTEKEQESGL